MTTDNFMRFALLEAEAAMEKGEIPVGCVIVKDKTIIAKAHNLRESEGQAASHAEMLAISKACGVVGDWRLDGCDIYVTMEPCPMCAGAIIQSRIKNVYFGCYDKKSGALGSVADISTYLWTHRPSVFGGIMEDECSFMLKSFFSKIRNE